jgi:hypothetical protein
VCQVRVEYSPARDGKNARPASAKSAQEAASSRRTSLAGSLVMKGSPVRVRASASFNHADWSTNEAMSPGLQSSADSIWTGFVFRPNKKGPGRASLVSGGVGPEREVPLHGGGGVVEDETQETHVTPPCQLFAQRRRGRWAATTSSTTATETIADPKPAAASSQSNQSLEAGTSSVRTITRWAGPVGCSARPRGCTAGRPRRREDGRGEQHQCCLTKQEPGQPQRRRVLRPPDRRPGPARRLATAARPRRRRRALEPD